MIRVQGESKYTFAPLEDITTQEFAMMLYVSWGRPSLSQAQFEEVPEQSRRHFQPIKKETK